VVPDGDTEEVAGLVGGVEHDAESAAVSRELRGATLLVDAIDVEAGEVERDLADVLGPDREDDLGLAPYLVARVGDGQADAVLLRVERLLARVVVARLRVREEAEEQRQRPEEFEIRDFNFEIPNFNLRASVSLLKVPYCCFAGSAGGVGSSTP
jgi:hypothetical protein